LKNLPITGFDLRYKYKGKQLMLNILNSFINNTIRDTTKLFRWVIDHPTLTLVLALNNFILPILAREIHKMYWQFECGTFEIHRHSAPGTPNTLYFYNDNVCFFPKGFKDLMVCYLGRSELFNQLEIGEHELGVRALGNPGITICDQFTKLIDTVKNSY
jgi:hypothetical protein